MRPDRRIDAAAIAVATVLLLLASLPTALSLFVVRSTDQLADDVAELDRLVLEINRLMVDQQTGVRGYVITGDERFLDPYQAARQRLDDLWTSATELAARVGGRTPALLEEARRTAVRWQIEAADPEIRLVRAGRADEAARFISSGFPKELFDRYRAASALLNEHVDQTRIEQLERRRELTGWQNILLVALALLGLIGLAAIYYLGRMTHRYHYQAAQSEEVLRAKDHFLALVAHELRTPVTAIKGHAQLLARRNLRTDEPPRQDEATLRHAGTIDRQATRLSRLIEQLLDVTLVETPMVELRFEPTDVVQIARRAVELVQPAAPHLRIELHAPPTLVAQVDGPRLEQVLYNLLDNAVKYSPVGQRIDVTLRAEGDDLFCSVSDEGMGVPVGERERLFERFYRASNAVPTSISGLGVGLYICAAIVARHGGRIGVDSQEGLGSTFWFRIPLYQDAPFTAAGDETRGLPSGAPA